MMDYSHKPGVVHAELLLPERAPPEFSSRASLWNSVERTEKQWNSQLARRLIMALPRELSQEENLKLVRQYCQEQFVDKGMCCDFAIHDEGNGNPHAHILLTMRALDENGQWLPKARKVYDLDENGERIRLPSGNWKSHKENTVDWNDQSKAELWRHEWETLQNRFLETAGRSERVSLQTLEHQGIEQIPTVHLGPAVTNMERKGIKTGIGGLQNEILYLNWLLALVRKRIAETLRRIEELRQSKEDFLHSLAFPDRAPTVSSLLWRHYEQREKQRQEWKSSAATKLDASAEDFNWVAETTARLEKAGLFTLNDLEDHLRKLDERLDGLHQNLRYRRKRSAELDKAIQHHESLRLNRSLYDEYSHIFFKSRKERFYSAHKHEIDAFRSALRFFETHEPERNSTIPQLRAAQADLAEKNQLTSQRIEQCKAESGEYRKICHWVQKAIDSSEPEHEPDLNRKPSIQKRLRESRTKRTEISSNESIRNHQRNSNDHEL